MLSSLSVCGKQTVRGASYDTLLNGKERLPQNGKENYLFLSLTRFSVR